MNIFGCDKLWGPSQRVVTLLFFCDFLYFMQITSFSLVPDDALQANGGARFTRPKALRVGQGAHVLIFVNLRI